MVVLMKLNNRGWGLNQMLILCAILLMFLMVAVFFIVQLSDSLGDVFQESIVGGLSYTTVEENIEYATEDYMEKYYEYEIGTGTITVTVDNLLKYDMIKDINLKPGEEADSCTGYSLVEKKKEKLIINAYIKCSDYETDGYQAWRLGEQNGKNA